MRRGDDVLELEQRAVGARLLGEHVQAGGGDLAGLERVVQRGLVDDAAAGGVDQHQAGLGLGELLGADQTGGLRGLRQVHAHEVGLGEERVEVDQPNAHLRGTAGLHVGVVGDHVHAERAQPLGDQHADPPEADDADGLLVELDAGVLRPLPLAVAQCGVGRADVAGRGEHQRDRELGGGDDVRGGRVDDHHTALGGGPDVDVVQADPGARDDLELLGRGQRLGVDLGGRPDQHGVDVRDRREQLCAVGAVAGPDLEVRAERLDGGRAEFFGDEYDGLAHVRASSMSASRQVKCTTLCPMELYRTTPRVRPIPRVASGGPHRRQVVGTPGNISRLWRPCAPRRAGLGVDRRRRRPRSGDAAGRQLTEQGAVLDQHGPLVQRWPAYSCLARLSATRGCAWSATDPVGRTEGGVSTRSWTASPGGRRSCPSTLSPRQPERDGAGDQRGDPALDRLPQHPAPGPEPRRRLVVGEGGIVCRLPVPPVRNARDSAIVASQSRHILERCRRRRPGSAWRAYRGDR